MYLELKSIFKTLIPKKFLFTHEPKFRFLLYQFYKGSTFECRLCGKKLHSFILLENGEKLCPSCGSISRTRRLWDILITASLLKEGISILDFSPSRSLYRVLKNRTDIHNSSTDLSGDFISDFHYNITNIPAEAGTHDLIICYHILEHIPEDMKAIQELYRVLKSGGTCIIQTPFKEGETYEDPSIDNDQDRIKHFGQKDHVRVYSAAGLKDRLVKSGFQVILREFSEPDDNRFGYKSKEIVLICTK
jgi:SAM-dependent methyltransferase